MVEGRSCLLHEVAVAGSRPSHGDVLEMAIAYSHDDIAGDHDQHGSVACRPSSVDDGSIAPCLLERVLRRLLCLGLRNRLVVCERPLLERALSIQ